MRVNIFFILMLLTVLGFSSVYASQDRFIKVNDSLTICLFQKGVGNQTVLFIHGWSNDKSIWTEQQILLSGYYRTVAVDLPGFGVSYAIRNDWTVDNFASDILTVVDKLNLDSIIIVGFSMGAGVAVETAKMIPEKTLGVILVDHFHNIDEQLSDSMMQGFADLYMDVILNPTLENIQPFVQTDKEKFLSLLKFKMKDQKKRGWREILLEYNRWINTDLKNSLRSLQCPVVSINSMYPETNAEAIKKLVPSFSVKFVEKAGHLLMWDAPDKFNTLLEETIIEMTQNIKIGE